jgi:hypothetical protein
MELLTGTGDKNDELALVLSSPAYGIEAGIAEGAEKTRILVLCLLCLLPGPLL